MGVVNSEYFGPFVTNFNLSMKIVLEMPNDMHK